MASRKAAVPRASSGCLKDLVGVDVQLRIELQHIQPHVWRRVIVPETITLAKLHQVLQAAKDAGVWVFGGGLENQKASIVATDGTVTDGPYPEAIGGLCVVDVPSREEALEWAAKIAVACRCSQEVRELLPDPTV